MESLVKAPWTLQVYAFLAVTTALSRVLLGGETWTQVAWAGIIAIGVCSGSRGFWWLVVVVVALVSVTAPFLLENWGLVVVPGAISLALLLAPPSREYVFGEPEPAAPRPERP